jgi:prophage regulatory protein
MLAQVPTTHKIIRRKQLESKIGLSRSAIYDRLDKSSPRYDPNFPKPIKLGSGKNPPIGFVESEVESWITSQIEKSRLS